MEGTRESRESEALREGPPLSPVASGLPDPEDVLRANARIRPWIQWTPMLLHPEWSETLGRPVYLKLESLQNTGSFKVRGAANRMLSLSEEEKGRGVVACSSGNHARAVAYMARMLGIEAQLFVPSWVDPAKLRAMEEAGARVVQVEGGYDEAEDRAMEEALAQDRTLIHPFDDPEVVAGQGTLGLEILHDLPSGCEPGDVWVPLSGGGLAAGVGLALSRSAHRLVTVSADRAAVMLRSLTAGHPVEEEELPTLASALSGGIGRPNRVTFPLLQSLPALHLEVSEASVEAGVALAYRQLRLVVEGGGAVGLAGLGGGGFHLDAVQDLRPEIRAAVTGRSGPLVLVLSGGNLDLPRLHSLLAGRQEGAGVPSPSVEERREPDPGRSS